MIVNPSKKMATTTIVATIAATTRVDPSYLELPRSHHQDWHRGEVVMKNEKRYLTLVEVESAHFRYFQIQQFPIAENQKAGKLA